MTKTYAQLTREIQTLQAHADRLHQTEKKEVIARLNASIAQYGLSAQDLRFPGNSASSSPSFPSSSPMRSANSGSTPRSSATADDVKYSDGPGRVWGGRGPRPAWLREAIAQGRSLESFAVTTGKAARRALGAGASTAKESLPPRYRHPKTGATWSGRGPKPAWLKQGLKKRGTSIDNFLISTQDSAPSPTASVAAPKPPARQKAPASRGGSGRHTGTPKAGADDRATRKSLTEKIAARTPAGSAPKAAPGVAAPAPANAPAGKAAAGKSRGSSASAPSSRASKAPATPKSRSPVAAPEPSAAKDVPATTRPAAPARKSAAKAGAKGVGDNGKARSPAKKAVPAKKNLPVSMAPSGEPAPAPSNAQTTTQPAPESGEAGSPAAISGN